MLQNYVIELDFTYRPAQRLLSSSQTSLRLSQQLHLTFLRHSAIMDNFIDSDVEKKRLNMIEGQIRPWKVSDHRVLDALR